jgi:hypothetical protein
MGSILYACSRAGIPSTEYAFWHWLRHKFVHGCSAVSERIVAHATPTGEIQVPVTYPSPRSFPT